MTAAMIPAETVSAESRAMTKFPEAPRSCLPKGAPVVPERRRHVQAKRLWERDPGPKPRARHDTAEVAPALANVAPIRAGVGDQTSPIAEVRTPGSTWVGGGRFLAGGAAPPSGHAAALTRLASLSSAALVFWRASRESQTWATVISRK